jgi:ribonuclease BN (tRNA processing enzyme)
MRLEMLGCSGGLGRGARLTGYRIGDVLIDAGHLSSIVPTTPRVVLLSHAHLDHLLHLPLLLTARIGKAAPTLEILGEPETLARLRHGLLDGSVYPDHASFPTAAGEPVARYRELDAAAVEVGCFGGVEVEVLRMAHTIPCLAFAVRAEPATGLVIGGDTADSTPLWSYAARAAWVKLVVVECSLPDEYHELAHASGHLTPAALCCQLRGFKRRAVRILVVHRKPGFERRIARQLHSHLGDRVELARAGAIYEV